MQLSRQPQRSTTRAAHRLLAPVLAGWMLMGLMGGLTALATEEHSKIEDGTIEHSGIDPVSAREAVQLQIVAAARRDTFALDWLETLCDSVGPRLTGSAGMDRAIEYAVKTMRREGFDKVWTEPVTVPRWERGREWAEMTAPIRQVMTISGLGGSIGTPPEGIEAEVMVVGDEEELARRSAEAVGKIVLFNPVWEGYGSVVRYRRDGASLAGRYGAVAALVRSATPYSLSTPHTGLMRYEEGSRQIPTASVTVEDAALFHRLAHRGVTIRARLSMAARSLADRLQPNVVGELRGRDLADEIVVVGAHLDTWDVGTGAHDDGAGCAIMVGATRLLQRLGLRPRRTIQVVLFVGEEQGGIGGDAFLQAHAHELDRYVAALESDSGAFAPDGFTVRSDPELMRRISTLAEPLALIGADNVREGWAGVDIGPIVDAGVPGIGHRVQGDHYFDLHHSPADTFDKIVPRDLADNVAAVAALVWAIAEYGLADAGEPAAKAPGDPLP